MVQGVFACFGDVSALINSLIGIAMSIVLSMVKARLSEGSNACSRSLGVLVVAANSPKILHFPASHLSYSSNSSC